MVPTNGQFASATDPSTWTSFETARDAATTDGEIAGVGFVFTNEDPLVGVDLDDCRDPATGVLEPWAESIVEALDSFTEISPSGTGVHTIVEGTLPGDRNRRGDVECYETARFFTVTGAHVDSTPTDVHPRSDGLTTIYHEHIASATETSSTDADTTSSNTTDPTGDAPAESAALTDDELIANARAAANGQKFERLFGGNTSGYESHSEADFALCSIIAFWSGGDPTQMDRLVRRSGLARPKWDDVHFGDGSTYGEKTIERAIAVTSEFYTPSDSGSDVDASPSATTTNQRVVTDEQLQRIETREHVRLRTIERLETEVRELTTERDRLAEQLTDERAQRQQLEDELEDQTTRTQSLRERFWGLFGRDEQAR
uniref:phage NrS-1 polymerase family protein n=1 Tax=Natronoarchaeum rubrum TaxID=755311 RepID=UPI002111A7CB|nr:hypothetical protein [Natronoarchaeum rubrum]